MARMNIVFIASEAAPLAKTGGLADVAGALPMALSRLGHKVSVILPYYRKQVGASGVRVHPLQYILIGLALALFYLLLLSISEYLGFKIAYLLSAITIIGLVTLYSKSIFKAWRPALLEALILVFVYGFIFVILQLEDYSLLVGSLGLLAILSLVMLVLRKIDWYSIAQK